jgi:NAD(P)-dependent dehydrogenase (short-subunit alcohol dehydrogenase family)
VTKLATIEAAKETIVQAEGKLDVLVNNAGTFYVVTFSIKQQADSRNHQVSVT